ncbi:hypothetical protein ATANTOWER_009995 [Ataeniobius toweri]|uniref:Uncharacterized protein n=1 Tax=Ataeniobius toweri TaxID=208326 RepID=A0ABU7AP65_9TELE|nr:hypothetical protein [Ataeniobius toweri]
MELKAPMVTWRSCSDPQVWQDFKKTTSKCSQECFVLLPSALHLLHGPGWSSSHAALSSCCSKASGLALRGKHCCSGLVNSSCCCCSCSCCHCALPSIRGDSLVGLDHEQ